MMNPKENFAEDVFLREVFSHTLRGEKPRRRDRRRSQDALQARNLITCSNCGSMRLPHTVCSNCGFYGGREVIEIKKEKKTTE